MELSIVLKGMVLGFSIAAPVGPIGVLCIRRTLAHGAWTGFVSGLGTATADALYGCVAAFGVTAISMFLLDQQTWLRLGGGLFLLYLGHVTFYARPGETAAQTRMAAGEGAAGAFLSAFVLTLTNPATILSFAAVFSGLGNWGTGGGYASGAQLVAGVFTGSALWWFILSMAVNVMRTRIQPAGMRWINRASGSVIAAFGVAALASLL